MHTLVATTLSGHQTGAIVLFLIAAVIAAIAGFIPPLSWPYRAIAWALAFGFVGLIFMTLALTAAS